MRSALENIPSMPVWLLVALFSFLTATLTELGTNVAVTVVTLPIVLKLVSTHVFCMTTTKTK